MSQFRRLSDRMLASPQITIDDIAAAQAEGVALIVNNRPEGEAGDQTPGAEIEAAARAAGLNYRAIPIGHSGFSRAQIEAMAEALERADGPVLGYCRSGTRSTLLWALAQASRGKDPETLSAAAERVGYDLTPVRPAMDMLAGQSR